MFASTTEGSNLPAIANARTACSAAARLATASGIRLVINNTKPTRSAQKDEHALR
jgi:hypothetical protein